MLEHPQLAQTLADAAARGVKVRLLLEGSPVGGVSDMQRWCVARMAAAGADVRYLAATEGAPSGYQPRYRYAHAKFGVVDARVSFVGTENLTWDAAPVPDGAPAGGRRGFFLITDTASVAQALAAIFAADWQPDRFLDLHPYQASHPKYGAPPLGYALPSPQEYPVEAAPFADAVTVRGPARFIVASAPENALRPDDGLFALLDRAGANDEILVAQLYEHKFWGDSDSNPVADPNPRLERLIDAARRGAPCACCSTVSTTNRKTRAAIAPRRTICTPSLHKRTWTSRCASPTQPAAGCTPSWCWCGWEMKRGPQWAA